MAVTSISNLKNHRFLEEFNLIPQKTNKITKELKRQLDTEQKQFQKDLENYYSWINQSHILLEVMLHTVNMKWKSYKKRSNFNKIMISIFFKKWSI